MPTNDAPAAHAPLTAHDWRLLAAYRLGQKAGLGATGEQPDQHHLTEYRLQIAYYAGYADGEDDGHAAWEFAEQSAHVASAHNWPPEARQ